MILDEAAILPVERALIGGVLLWPEAEVPPLEAGEFLSDRHGLIWAAIRQVATEAHPDLVSVYWQLSRSGDLEAAGGWAYLALCLEEASILPHVPHYARLVRRAWRERAKRSLGEELARRGLSDAEIRDRLESLPGPLTGALFDPAEVWGRIVGAWQQQRWQTGWIEFDRHVGGFGPGEFTVVGGRTSHGKTAWLVALALRLAEQGVGVEYVTLEDPPEAIVRRAVALQTGLSVRRLRDGSIGPGEFRQAEAAVERLQALPLTVTGVDHLGSLDEEAVVPYVAAARGPVLIVDHLQQITTRDPSRVYGLERVLKRLQAVALRGGRALFLAAQLNRETEARQGPPRLSDLRDCGAIEQAARRILLLYWPSKHDAQRPAEQYECYIAKDAEGGTGVVRFRFEAWCGRFEDALS
ncbi:MAG TPA: DnaB-like helicase C-terminal domain-containing protein [Actinomycetota bacterium]|nr:DnaB-like helicase C-terminal domain-containing protein [Actinomycetota bacterium]